MQQASNHHASRIARIVAARSLRHKVRPAGRQAEAGKPTKKPDIFVDGYNFFEGEWGSELVFQFTRRPQDARSLCIPHVAWSFSQPPAQQPGKEGEKPQEEIDGAGRGIGVLHRSKGWWQSRRLDRAQFFCALPWQRPCSASCLAADHPTRTTLQMAKTLTFTCGRTCTRIHSTTTG